MKKSKFTEAQIAFALQQTDSGVSVQEVCRKMGISEATFYNWKKKLRWLRHFGITEIKAAGRRKFQVKTDCSGFISR